MASRQGLKRGKVLIYNESNVSRQWNGFPSGIETSRNDRDAERACRRQWNGFPSGIETMLRLLREAPEGGRQWNGFPSGIETWFWNTRLLSTYMSPVEWLPVRD